MEQVSINRVDVVDDAIDNEVVVVNLKNGRYYSLVDSGAVIWKCLADGLSMSGTVAHLLERYAGDEPVVRQAVETFVAELLNEGLVLTSEVLPAPNGVTQTPGSLGGAAATRTPFQAPVISKHVDMEGLLLLDPVHDVAAEGWPNRAQ